MLSSQSSFSDVKGTQKKWLGFFCCSLCLIAAREVVQQESCIGMILPQHLAPDFQSALEQPLSNAQFARLQIVPLLHIDPLPLLLSLPEVKERQAVERRRRG